MSDAEWSWPRLVAAVVVPALLGVAWAAVWHGIWLLLVFSTCHGEGKCFAVTTYFAGATTPALYLPFLTKRLVRDITENNRVRQTAFWIAVAWAILFSLLFSWWAS